MMNENDKTILKTAYNFVISILSYGEPTTEALYDLMEITAINDPKRDATAGGTQENAFGKSL